MPHLFVDQDDFIPGGLGGLDDGDSIPPRTAVRATPEEIAAAPVVGYFYPYRDCELEVVFLHDQLVVRISPEFAHVTNPYVIEDCYPERAPGGRSSDEHYLTADRLVPVSIFGFGTKLARASVC